MNGLQSFEDAAALYRRAESARGRIRLHIAGPHAIDPSGLEILAQLADEGAEIEESASASGCRLRTR